MWRFSKNLRPICGNSAGEHVVDGVSRQVIPASPAHGADVTSSSASSGFSGCGRVARRPRQLTRACNAFTGTGVWPNIRLSECRLAVFFVIVFVALAGQHVEHRTRCDNLRGGVTSGIKPGLAHAGISRQHLVQPVRRVLLLQLAFEVGQRPPGTRA